jgi:hypothetical protein
MTLTTPSGLNGPVSVLDAPVSAAAAGTYTIEVGAARATVTPPSPRSWSGPTGPSPGRIGLTARAALVLVLFEHEMIV